MKVGGIPGVDDGLEMSAAGVPEGVEPDPVVAPGPLHEADRHAARTTPGQTRLHIRGSLPRRAALVDAVIMTGQGHAVHGRRSLTRGHWPREVGPAQFAVAAP